MIITPNFHFNGNCKEAIELYKRAFDLKVLSVLEYKDANPDDFKADSTLVNYIYHAEVLLDNNRIMMSDDMSKSSHINGNSISLVITFDTADDVKYTYRILKEDAEIINPIQSTSYSSCMVSLIDKYGIRWELMTEQTER